ncbi:MAG: hypothetical protein EA397_08245 [Deltaproteobacteria bacterium]|nr:MAG: hypothetical protein EA397_08245 [Deltaproteobacteria bacterium]
MVEPVEGWLVWAVIHGLDHVEGEHGMGAVCGRVRALLRVPDHAYARRGLAVHGAWYFIEEREPPLDLALSLAGAPAALGLVYGEVAFLDGVPQGRVAQIAQTLATAVRHGEVLHLADQLRGLELPLGVGRFDAPSPLALGAPSLGMLRDYRGELVDRGA